MCANSYDYWVIFEARVLDVDMTYRRGLNAFALQRVQALLSLSIWSALYRGRCSLVMS